MNTRDRILVQKPARDFQLSSNHFPVPKSFGFRNHQSSYQKRIPPEAPSTFYQANLECLEPKLSLLNLKALFKHPENNAVELRSYLQIQPRLSFYQAARFCIWHPVESSTSLASPQFTVLNRHWASQFDDLISKYARIRSTARSAS